MINHPNHSDSPPPVWTPEILANIFARVVVEYTAEMDTLIDAGKHDEERPFEEPQIPTPNGLMAATDVLTRLLAFDARLPPHVAADVRDVLMMDEDSEDKPVTYDAAALLLRKSMVELIGG